MKIVAILFIRSFIKVNKDIRNSAFLLCSFNRDGKEEGTAFRFHENGMMSDSANYANGHRKGISVGWDKEGNQVDSSKFDGMAMG